MRGNGRGNPDTLLLRTTQYLAMCIEAGSLAQEALSAAERIHAAAVVGDRRLVAHEAGRLSHHAAQYRESFRAWAAEVER
jgi:hypothetical protein